MSNENIDWINTNSGKVVATVDGEGEGPKGTVYVCPSTVWQSDVAGTLLLDTGEAAWGHMSSGMGWLLRDLTVGFGDRKRRLEALYPNGYDVVLAAKDDDIPSEVLDRNKAWAEARDTAQEPTGNEVGVSHE